MKEIQQLTKKENQTGNYQDIFPKTFLDAVVNRETGVSLDEILTGFNMYFLTYLSKIQISRDNQQTWQDLSSEFVNNLYIKGYVATVSDLPSSAVQGDIYGVGPTYDPSDTEQTNPIYQLYVKDSTGWVNNGRFTSIAAGVVQELGNSETTVISQKKKV